MTTPVDVKAIICAENDQPDSIGVSKNYSLVNLWWALATPTILGEG
jgi:hypothetical protein